MKTPKSVRTADRPVLGPANAKVRIVAFSDFTCHFCQQASHTLDALMRQYGKDVSLVFKNLPLDEKGPGPPLQPTLRLLRNRMKIRPGPFTERFLPTGTS